MLLAWEDNVYVSQHQAAHPPQDWGVFRCIAFFLCRPDIRIVRLPGEVCQLACIR
jgi:hypothetical protein